MIYCLFDSSQIRLFRVVPAAAFLALFASDRSHMSSARTPFPTWPPIRGHRAGSDMNLMRFVDMRRSDASLEGEERVEEEDLRPRRCEDKQKHEEGAGDDLKARVAKKMAELETEMEMEMEMASEGASFSR